MLTFGALGACSQSGVPSFELFPSGTDKSPGGSSGPFVSEVLRQLACQEHDLATAGDIFIPTGPLARASQTGPLDAANAISLKDVFDNIAFVSYATLTLDVTNTQAVNPSLNFINPMYYHPIMGVASSVAASNTFNSTLAISGQFAGQQHRNITLNLNWDYDKLDPLDPSEWDPSRKLDCQNAGAGPGGGLAGVLALGQIVEMGLMANNEQNDLAVPPSSAFVKNLPFPGTMSGGAPLGSTLTGVFGSQIDFTLTEGLGGGPSFAQLHFKESPAGGASLGGGERGSGGGGGGGGGNNGPLNISRMAKDTLVISFAPACLRNEHPTRKDAAATVSPRRPLAALPTWARALKCCQGYTDPARRGETNEPSAGPVHCPHSNLPPMDAMKESAEAKQSALGAARMNTNSMILQNIPTTLER